MEPTAECPNCKILAAQLAELRKELDALRAEVRQSKRSRHRFSRREKNPKPKKSGRKPGEGSFRHRNPPEKADRTIPVPLEQCPDCQGPLAQRRQHQHWQTDIPPITPEVTEFVTTSGYCAGCRQRKRSAAPDQLVTATGAAAHGIGPHLAGLVAKLKHENGMPYQQIAELCRTVFGITVTPGALAQCVQRLGERLKPAYDELKAELRTSKQANSDGTGWHVGNLRACLWTFSNCAATLYVIDQRFGHEVVLETLGSDYAGVLSSDRHGAYRNKALKDWNKQFCNLHLLRNLNALLEKKTRGARLFGLEVKDILRQAMALAKQRDEVPDYAERAQVLKTALARRVSPSRRWSDKENAKMAASLHQDLPHVLRYLDDPSLEATNNRAERDLRPAVVARKMGRCNKGEAGAKAHAIICSILATLRKRAVNPLEGLRQMLSMTRPGFDAFSLPP